MSQDPNNTSCVTEKLGFLNILGEQYFSMQLTFYIVIPLHCTTNCTYSFTSDVNGKREDVAVRGPSLPSEISSTKHTYDLFEQQAFHTTHFLPTSVFKKILIFKVILDNLPHFVETNRNF
jgi:hypothetical protein